MAKRPHQRKDAIGRTTAEVMERRFWDKVSIGDGCWEWLAGKTGSGYGAISIPNSGQRMIGAHRYAYELMRGAIPEGLHIDHLCRNPGCVNPAHLEPVTSAENIRRSRIAVERRGRTHCPQGHPYDEENTYRNPNSGDRACRECGRENCRRRRRRRKEAGL